MMSDLQATPDLLAEFGVQDPELVTTTNIATIWKVRQNTGGDAALKQYHRGQMGNEAAGFRLLKALDGAGVARVVRYTKDAALIEWLEGLSLGDLVRAGDDERAGQHLIKVAREIHAAPQPAPDGYPKLEEWLKDLFNLRFTSDCSVIARQDIERCKLLARELLAKPVDIRVLHGDLHHDNIHNGARGWLAFDAKGVVGERGFELANAFRNPSGADAIIRDPAHLNARAALWSDGFEIDRQRLLSWAAVKSALSIAWRGKGVLRDDPELDLPGIFLHAAGVEI